MPFGEVEGFIVLLIAVTVGAVFAQWIRLSFTLALLLLGLVLGTIPGLPVPALNAEVILLLFLPPLLFESAFVLNLRQLWAVRRGVLVLALPGVLLAMVVGGSVVHWGLGLPWSVALLFGAMIAATDPVAVLATFRHLSVDARLSVLIEGESLFNDGTALVLFGALIAGVTGTFELGTVTAAFALSVVSGLAIGAGIGWVGHWLIASVDEHLTEMTVSVATAYAAFLVADTLHLSGVLATIAGAMTLGSLGRQRGWVFSEGSERLLSDLWAFLAFIANATLFLLMGLTVRVVGLTDHPLAVFAGIAAALLGRAAVAYGLGSLLGQVGVPLTWPERHVLFWGGLRGAVALAAALSLPHGFPYREQLLAMTYGVVLFTLFVQGLTITPLVRRLGLQQGAAG
jgi:monovalent cation:H+ antiporter, CPA1 family